MDVERRGVNKQMEANDASAEKALKFFLVLHRRFRFFMLFDWLFYHVLGNAKKIQNRVFRFPYVRNVHSENVIG